MSRESLCANDLYIINKYSDMVYRMAYSLVKNKYDAEDIHQEVFVRYIGRKPKFASEDHEKAWFLRVTINLCKNLWKTAWRQKVISLGEDWEENVEALNTVDRINSMKGMKSMETIESAEENALIDAVKKLPQKYRVVIHLFYYEELSIEAISKVLQMKPATVRTHLTRARGKLKGMLEEMQQQ